MLLASLLYMRAFVHKFTSKAILAILYVFFIHLFLLLSGTVSRRAKDEETKSPPGFRLEIVLERKQ